MLSTDHVKTLPSGIAAIHILAGQNNTLVSLSDWQFRLIKTMSGGVCGLKGHLRGTSESGTRTATRIAQLALKQGFRDVFVYIRGFGPGRETAFRTLVASGLNILKITDRTPIPHGGCRPRKARRI
jgi:small subunit ribosomal protein S11